MPQGQPQKAAPGARKAQTGRAAWEQLVTELTPFHTPQGEAYVILPRNGHRETWPVKSTAVRDWLRMNLGLQDGTPPSSRRIDELQEQLATQARCGALEQAVFMRVARCEDKRYLDLANPAWQVVELSETGWRLIAADSAPIRFERRKGMQALPAPEPGAPIDALRDFLNIAENDFLIVLAWLVQALQPAGPYPVLVLQGEPGTAKSTTAKVLRALVDPHVAPLRALPKDANDLFLAARNQWVLCYDNLSGIPGWVSDVLCQLATGGGYARRALYTDSDEVLFTAQQPVIVNGIDDLATRHDLLDRALVLELPRVSAERRREEAQFWQDFETARPRLLGALLDLSVKTLQNQPIVELSQRPRMADFARLGCALTMARGLDQEVFSAALNRQRAEAIETGLSINPIAEALRALVDKEGAFEGTPSELLSKLESYAPNRAAETRVWPKAPNALSHQLKLLTPTLQEVGIVVERVREPDRKRGRTVRITCLQPTAKT